MRMTGSLRRTGALSVVAVWACLTGLCLADRIEDVQEKSDPLDRMVIAALAMPAESGVFLSQELPATTPTAPAFLSQLPVLVSPSVLTAALTFSGPVPGQPPPRAGPKLFQLFSVYRV